MDKTINTFLNLKLAPPSPVTTVNKDVRYFKLPYMGKLSFEVRKSFKHILKNAYPQIKFNFVFTNSNNIRNFLTKKPKPSPELCSNVVYLFQCPSCPARYVGSTSRWLKHRIQEHKGRSFRTGLQLGKPAFSSIREHSHEHSHYIHRFFHTVPTYKPARPPPSRIPTHQQHTTRAKWPNDRNTTVHTVTSSPPPYYLFGSLYVISFSCLCCLFVPMFYFVLYWVNSFIYYID